MDSATTILPILTPREDKTIQQPSGSDRRHPARARGHQPQSARLGKEDKHDQELFLHEDAVRIVYKKHAESFFEEIKEGFLKEAAALRKQTQRAFAKGNALDDDHPSDDPSASVADLQAQVTSLKQQLGDLRASQSTSDLRAGSSLASESKYSLPALADKVSRQQDELRGFVRHVKSELSYAKKAALTPMWKERALQEIAQGELRGVCAEEVGKAFGELAASFTQNHVEAAVVHLSESGGLPWETRMRDEVLEMKSQFDVQFDELTCRCDESSQAHDVIVDRVAALEKRHDQRIEELHKLQTESQVSFTKGLGSLETRLQHLEGLLEEKHQMLGARCSQVEAVCDKLQAATDKEVAGRVADIARLETQLGVLEGRCTSLDAQVKEEMRTRSATLSCVEGKLIAMQSAAADTASAANHATQTAQQAASVAAKADQNATNADLEAKRAANTANTAVATVHTETQEARKIVEAAGKDAAVAMEFANGARVSAEAAQRAAAAALDRANHADSATAQFVSSTGKTLESLGIRSEALEDKQARHTRQLDAFDMQQQDLHRRVVTQEAGLRLRDLEDLVIRCSRRIEALEVGTEPRGQHAVRLNALEGAIERLQASSIRSCAPPAAAPGCSPGFTQALVAHGHRLEQLLADYRSLRSREGSFADGKLKDIQDLTKTLLREVGLSQQQTVAASDRGPSRAVHSASVDKHVPVRIHPGDPEKGELPEVGNHQEETAPNFSHLEMQILDSMMVTAQVKWHEEGDRAISVASISRHSLSPSDEAPDL